ncbi:MAG: hypothetical protein H0V44_07955 [Planctomycetes bacterium]|nr:hypothetical protein [Planctomycetota bacterium]
MRMRLVVVLSAAICGWSWCQEPAAPVRAAADPLAGLPVLAKTLPATVDAPEAKEEVAPGVRMVRNERVVLDGTFIIDKGPVDGMEVLACLKDGKTHEALIRLQTTNGQLVKFAVMAALGLPDGVPAPEGSGLPARGTPVRVRALWKDDLGAWRSIDVSCLVRDRVIDRGYPPLPFTYTGSRFQVVQEPGPDGSPVRHEKFMLDTTRSVIASFDEPDALLASPFPGAIQDARFEANSALLPPVDTPVQVVIERTELPLALGLDDQGQLTSAAGDVLDDAGLGAELAKHFGAGTEPGLRAVGVRVARSVDRGLDVAARSRILSAAAAAKAWVVPVFILAPE